MPKVPYPYEVNGKLVIGNGSLSNRSLLQNLTVFITFIQLFVKGSLISESFLLWLQSPPKYAKSLS